MKITKYFFLILFVIILISGLLFFFQNKQETLSDIEPVGNTSVENIKPGGLSLLSWHINHLEINVDAGDENPLDNIFTFMNKQEADVFLLQNVAALSRYSLKNTQAKIFANAFPDYLVYRGLSRNAFLPFSKNNVSKISMSRYFSEETSTMHINLSNSFLPLRKNTLLVTEIDSAVSGKKWYIVNINLSDKNAEIDKQLFENINKYIAARYKEGHYVVLGGNWGGTLPGFRLDFFNSKPINIEPLNTNWFPDNWAWCFDQNYPSEKLDENTFAITDGFLVSPNLRVDIVRSFDLNFKDSTHNPVLITVSIR